MMKDGRELDWRVDVCVCVCVNLERHARSASVG